MAQTLQTLLEGIYVSVLEARRFVNQQHLDLFKSYFEVKRVPDPETGGEIEAYVPRLVAMATSTGVGENERFEIFETPAVTLIPLNTLAIDTMEIEFETKLNNLNILDHPDAANEDTTPPPEDEPDVIRRTIDDLFGTASEITIMNKGDSFESGTSPAKVKITFKLQDPPEGAALIQEQLLDYLRR